MLTTYGYDKHYRTVVFNYSGYIRFYKCRVVGEQPPASIVMETMFIPHVSIEKVKVQYLCTLRFSKAPGGGDMGRC